MDKHMHNDGTWPYIHWFGIGEVAQNLRSHIQHSSALWRSGLRIMKIKFGAKSKICDLELIKFMLIRKKNVVLIGKEVPGLISRWIILTEWMWLTPRMSAPIMVAVSSSLKRTPLDQRRLISCSKSLNEYPKFRCALVPSWGIWSYWFSRTSKVWRCWGDQSLRAIWPTPVNTTILTFWRYSLIWPASCETYLDCKHLTVWFVFTFVDLSEGAFTQEGHYLELLLELFLCF